MSEPTTVNVNVRKSGDTYVAVNRTFGVKAASVTSEQRAAELVGQKLFGPAYVGVQLLDTGSTYKPSIWLLSADPKAYAWCWASGLIELHDARPGADSGAVTFASGPKRLLEAAIWAVARQGRDADKDQWFVPGVPEEKSQKDRMTTLILWVNRQRAKQGPNFVVFGRDEEV